jgi:hypothetical protein
MTEEMKKRLDIKNGLKHWQNDHRLIVMIGGSILVALFLVVFSMKLYDSSGAAQLDLSRPGYSAVRDQARPNDSIDAFSGSGSINSQTLQDFDKLFSRYAEEATAVDAFGGDVLSDAELGIGEASTQEAEL